MFRSPHSRLLLFTMILSASTSFAQSDESSLRRHVNKDGRFEAMMPANARSIEVPGKEIIDTYYEARGKAEGAEFRLKVQVISPIDLGEKLKKETAAMYVGQAREQLEKTFGEADKDEAVAQHGMVGRDFVHRISKKDSPNGQELVFQQRVLYDGKRLYIATHIGSPDAATAKLGKLFLDSVQPLSNN